MLKERNLRLIIIKTHVCDIETKNFLIIEK